MKPQTVTLDEMREIVGQKIFGVGWVGSLSDADYRLFNEHAPTRRPRGGVDVAHLNPTPPKLTAKLDRVLGKRIRQDAQYATVDSWIEDHGLPLDGKMPIERKAFQKICRDNFSSKPAPTAGKRGPKATQRPRVVAEMIGHLRSRALTELQLRDLPNKEMEARYSAGRETCNLARKQVLLDWKK
jgi:hypothetical protein